ncbi:MAG: LLM class flavin-dependent oxidoreductase [Chloroflexi bacterium CFX7]|nr:LLM class flavin-dependent oxidoreductase [Chloroflexi bacterium CFX7]RIL02931.1 MAG: hypothetical protein DCC78_05680 [bacterium]
MKYGLVVTNPGWLDGHWDEIDSSPFEALYVIDHPSLPGPDPWPYLAYVAGKTRRIRLGTHVTGAPFHHPAELARAVATVDHLSGGRAILGIGAGWTRADFEPYGFPHHDFGRRVAQLDEMVGALRALWTGSAAPQQGEWWKLAGGGVTLPRPVQQPHPPIVIGLNVPGKAAAIAVAHAQGINTWQLGPGQVAPLVADLRERCAAAGRDPATLAITADVLFAREQGRERAEALAERVANFARTGGRGGPATQWHAEGVLYGDADQMAEQVQAFSAAGVEELSVTLANMADVAWFAEHVAGR